MNCPPKTALFGNAFHRSLKTHCIHFCQKKRCVFKFSRTSVDSCGRKNILYCVSQFLGIFQFLLIKVNGAGEIPSLTQSCSNCFLVVVIFRTFQFWQTYSLFHQGNFTETPVVLVTSEHLKTGQEYDAALIWTEDVTSSSFQVCLRELQNFDGKHEDISVVCVRSKIRGIFIALKRKERTGESFLSGKVVAKQDSLGNITASIIAQVVSNRRSTQLLCSRYENATPILCWVFCALLGFLWN